MNIQQLYIFLKDGEWIKSPEDNVYFSSSDVAFRFNLPEFTPLSKGDVNRQNEIESLKARKQLKYLDDEKWYFSDVTFSYNNLNLVKLKLFKVVGDSHDLEL
ncbi:hypothetical protein OHV47_13220, partial [Acinetobacter baumannii]|nr:hypothetical protein [Acinetobacter baumannii]